MSRYVNRFPITNVELGFLSSEIARYIASEGFKLVDYKSQQVWKKGVGLVTGPQYLAITYMPTEIVVEAFIKLALLPGVYVCEMGIDGFFGAAPKALLRKRVNSVEQYLMGILQTQIRAYQNAAAAQSSPN